MHTDRPHFTSVAFVNLADVLIQSDLQYKLTYELTFQTFPSLSVLLGYEAHDFGVRLAAQLYRSRAHVEP